MAFDETRLKSVFAETFGIDAEDVTETSSPETVQEWKSLNHLALMTAVEDEFGISFSMAEMTDVDSYKELREVTARHMGC